MPPRPLTAVLLALTVLRCVVAGAQELTPGEAHLWLCGRHPALGYFHHGPLAAWLSGAGDWLAGGTPLGARLFAPWLMLAVCLLGWRLALSAFGEKTAGWFVAVLQLTPLFNIGAIRALPETTAVAAGVAAWWWLWQALHRASPWAWQWLAAGAALGLAMLAAPLGVLAGAGLVVVLSVPRRWRGHWRKPGPWLALLALGIVALPWIAWQARVDWLPWRSAWFAWGKEASPMDFPRWVWRLVLAASPIVGAGMAWAAGDGLRQGVISWRRRRRGGLQADDPFDQKDGRVFLLALAAPGAVWALASALAGEGTLAQAALPGLAALLLLVARWMEAPLPPSAHRLAQNAALLIAAAYSLLALHSDLARHAGLRWPYALDPTAEQRGWRESAAQTARAASVLSRQNGGAPVFFLAETPGLAASLAFYLPAFTEGLPLVQAPVGTPLCQVPRTIAVEDDFAFWPGYDSSQAFAGQAAIFAAESAEPGALALLRRHFTTVESYGAFEVRRGGLPVRKLILFACRGCQRPAQ